MQFCPCDKSWITTSILISDKVRYPVEGLGPARSLQELDIRRLSRQDPAPVPHHQDQDPPARSLYPVDLRRDRGDQFLLHLSNITTKMQCSSQCSQQLFLSQWQWSRYFCSILLSEQDCDFLFALNFLWILIKGYKV